ncbi:monalysin family beta-barrel pore-forming toxin [Pseudomonas sp. SORT22]|uniref:monalysin family beta-barrel pore-forming toxin n=1 Tax=Pseudomonas sp. SORT22 TaxID=2813842 RepID=UPI001BCB85EE|nr:monalysin family beta-barrel pore-forming toxin [Pseudomonas sp. SORT22]QVM95772.1 monalysin family beta-barrel pore-forming toxin [Pseudomonas sp. SORT22]
MNKQPEIRNLPFIESDYEIDHYLFAEGASNYGCWVNRDTVKGHVNYLGSSWDVETRAIFAYLEYLRPLVNKLSVEQTFKVTTQQGMSKSYATAISKTYGAGIKLGAIRLGAEITESSVYGETFSESSTDECSLSVPAHATNYVYQVNMVYANKMLGGGKFKLAADNNIVDLVVDEFQRVTREDLIFLTSFATQKIVMLPSDASINPYSWEQIKKSVLFEGYQHYNEEQGEIGFWSF